MIKKTMEMAKAGRAAILGALLTTLVLITAGTASAQRVEGIAAVVNDDVITYGEVYDRMDVVIKSSNLPDTKEFRDRIKAQVLDGLITEQIQMQEAARLEIDVTDDLIKQGFTQIAQQNNMEVERFMSILERQGLPLSSMARQIKAQMGWGEVIQKKLRSQVTVSDQDVDAEIMRMRRQAGKTEYDMAEIFLPIRQAADEPKVRDFADRLVAQLRQGASFSSLAREFSASAGAAQGGLLGWVTEDNLAPALVAAVRDLDKGQFKGPTRTDRGFHIILLRGKRQIDFADPDDVTLDIKELFLPVDEETEGRGVVAARQVAENLTGCVDIALKAEDWPNARLEEYSLQVAKLPENERPEYLKQDIGAPFNWGRPVTEDGFIRVQMVCAKKAPQGNVPDREEIRRKIGTQRIDILQRSYLRDLKSQAYIENRLE